MMNIINDKEFLFFESYEQEKDKTLNIFDFDGTLFDSPVPNPSMHDKQELHLLNEAPKRGGYGWYQNVITLDSKYLNDFNFISDSLNKVKESISNPNSITVLLTGRSSNYMENIKKILSKESLEFDDIGLKPIDDNGSTMDFKLNFINKMIEKYNPIHVNMWDDRISHVKKFKDFLFKKDINHNVYLVDNGEHHFSEEIETLITNKLKKNKPNFYAVILDDISHKLLLDIFSEKIPSQWKIFAHHMTIKYGSNIVNPDVDIFIKKYIGNKFNLKVTHLGMSDMAIAVKVETNVPSNNSNKHITIAVHPNGKPVMSNEITDWKPIESFEVSGKLFAQ